MKRIFPTHRGAMLALTFLLAFALSGMAQVPTVEWDHHSLIIDGRRVVPVMGEVHYSRIPAEEVTRIVVE